MRVAREDFELACIREFSHSGRHLGAGVSREERRERIRAAILQEKKARLRWRGSRFTYAEAYAQAYNQVLGADDTHGSDWEQRGSGRVEFEIEENIANDDEAVE